MFDIFPGLSHYEQSLNLNFVNGEIIVAQE